MYAITKHAYSNNKIACALNVTWLVKGLNSYTW